MDLMALFLKGVIMFKKKSKLIFRFSFLFLLIFSFLVFPFTNFSYAEDIIYSNVLEDLQKDKGFDSSFYPNIQNDYSLNVIQIAESDNKELFIYVYQPSGEDVNLVSTQIRISTSLSDSAHYFDYDLELLNSKDTLYKYKVKDLVVSSEAVRYYDIVCIFRDWNENFDKPTGNDNEINYVSFDVSKFYTVFNIDNSVYYTCKDTDVVQVTGKYVGYLTYDNSVIFNSTWTDAHFVAFSTNYSIDSLIEVDISYVEKYCKRVGNGLFEESSTIVLDGPYDRFVTITADDSGDLLTNNSWFPHNYSFKRIVSVSEFKELENLSSSASSHLEGMQWVLRFAETERDGGYKNTTDGATWSDVSEITILKLKFETEGVVYNLGVVDNKQSGDDIADNVSNPWWNWLFIVALGLVGFIILIVLFPSILIGLFKILWFFIIGVFKVLWWIIKAPFSIFK